MTETLVCKQPSCRKYGHNVQNVIICSLKQVHARRSCPSRHAAFARSCGPQITGLQRSPCLMPALNRTPATTRALLTDDFQTISDSGRMRQIHILLSRHPAQAAGVTPVLHAAAGGRGWRLYRASSFPRRLRLAPDTPKVDTPPKKMLYLVINYVIYLHFYIQTYNFAIQY